MGDFKQNLKNQRERFVNVFNDTLNYIKENIYLNNKTEEAKRHNKFYNYSYRPETALKKGVSFFNNVFVTKHKTLEAAIELRKAYPNSKIAVLNFASATTPGGGVTKGSSAQEESICRCSTLYPCLNCKESWDKFYTPHRNEGSVLHNDDILYTPSIIICKSDDGNYTRLPEKNFVEVDVITCAAPNLRENPSNQYNSYNTQTEQVTLFDDELYKIHLSRAKAILDSAVENGVEVIVLGAFGCGAFKNNPYVVARAYREVLKDYAGKFKEIEFAIYCKGYETENFDAFNSQFN